MGQDFKNILILRGGAIGDFVLTLPAIRAIRTALPSARVRLIGHPHVTGLAVGRGYADAASALEAPDLAPLFAPGGELRGETAKGFEVFDLIVAFWRDERGVLAANLAKVCPGKVLIHDPLPPPAGKIHAVDHLCAVLAGVGVAEYEPTPRLFPTPDDLSAADAVFAYANLSPGRTVAIHPGSGGRTKNWPADRFADVARRVASETRCRVLAVCGPADEECMPALKGDLAFAENLPLPVLAAALSRCRAYLGNDSGITHIAAAAGAPTIAIFGPTDPEVWGPRGENVAIVRGQAPCSPCSREDRLRCADRRCLMSVTVEEVWRKVREEIGKSEH